MEGDMEANNADVEIARAEDGAVKSQELDELKKRLKEMEEVVSAVREMQAKFEKEMVSVQDPASAAATQASREEADSQSVFVGNVAMRRSRRNAQTDTSTSTPAPPSQIHPIASKRRRRAEREVINPQIEEEQEVEENEVGEDRQRDEDEDEAEEVGEDPQPDEDASGPFPGGPEDPSILKSFNTHIAHSIWQQQERPPLKCHQHATKINHWDWKTEPRQFRSRVKHSGLLNLVKFSYKSINRVLVSSFVERWHPETNTFHLPFGEMTITLDDVSQIISIPVQGYAVTGSNVSTSDAIDLLVDMLGVDRDDATDELHRNRGNAVKMEWLRSRLQGVGKKVSDETKDCAARGYLLYLLGCTLFSDKTGTKVPVMYLQLLKNLDTVKEYAWGAGALAYLYRQLGYASRSGVRQIAGYLTLLEAWVYEHFPFTRPNPDLTFEVGLPRVKRWMPRAPSGDPAANLKVHREALDFLEPQDVIWDPYKDSRDTYPFVEIAFFTGCLRFCDVVEPYQPDRVLRQFGHIQSIPPPPLAPRRAKRGATTSQYRVVYDVLDQYWDRWYSHLLAKRVRGLHVVNPWDCVDGYLMWFHRISHIYVQNPANRTGYDPRGHRAHINAPTVAREDEWVVYRDQALNLLQESFEMNENQTVQTMIERERQIYNILCFDAGEGSSKGKGKGKGKSKDTRGRR